METQLLDVVLSINSYDKTDAGIPYTISEIYKLDIDSKDIDKFKEMIFNSHAVLNVDKLVAKDTTR